VVGEENSGGFEPLLTDVPAPAASISVAMSTYNRVGSLAIVLPALLADPGTAELVVVSNGSSDGTAEYLTELAAREPKLHPIILAAPGLGRIGGRRTAIEATTGSIVLIVDDDVLATPGLVAGHARRHADHDGPLVVVGYMPTSIPDKPKPGSFSRVMYACSYNKNVEIWEKEPDRLLIEIWGGNISYPRDLYLEIDAARYWPANSYLDDKFYGIMISRRSIPAVFDRSLRAAHLYSRDLPASLEDWRLQGRDWIILHRTNSDVLGPPDLGKFTEGLRLGLAWFVRLNDHDWVFKIVRACLIPLVRLGVRTRIWPLEMKSAQLLRRIVIRNSAAAEFRGEPTK
jgi:glycosyltransferase involved in cell wall biosynthesis